MKCAAPTKENHEKLWRERVQARVYEAIKIWLETGKINQNDLRSSLHWSINVNRMRFKYNLRDLNRWAHRIEQRIAVRTSPNARTTDRPTEQPNRNEQKE